MFQVDITIIGAGVVGLAIAHRLSVDYPDKSILVLEKNSKYGQETSARNSEVIHSGIYYPKNSLKATLCVEGRASLYDLCLKNNISFQKITKIITATLDEAIPKLENLYQIGIENGVPLEIIDQPQANKLEPNIRCVGGILSPETGIISVAELMDFHYQKASNSNVDFYFESQISQINLESNGYKINLLENNSLTSFLSTVVINSAGLYADVIAEMVGFDTAQSGYDLSFCKGTYYSLRPAKRGIVKRLIYPIPPNEGLGVHSVSDIAGTIRFGPDVEYLPEKILDYSINENRKSEFLTAIQDIIPSIKLEDISADYCGIRPKLQKKGQPFRDFIINEESDKGFPNFINLIGIESPGLTASPAISRMVSEFISQIF